MVSKKQKMEISRILSRHSEGPELYGPTVRAIEKKNWAKVSSLYSGFSEGPDLYVKIRKIFR